MPRAVSTWKRGLGKDRLHRFSSTLRNPEFLAVYFVVRTLRSLTAIKVDCWYDYNYTKWMLQKIYKTDQQFFRSRAPAQQRERHAFSNANTTATFPTYSKKSQQYERTWPHVFYLQSVQRILELKKIALLVSRTKKSIVFSTFAKDSGGV